MAYPQTYVHVGTLYTTIEMWCEIRYARMAQYIVVKHIPADKVLCILR